MRSTFSIVDQDSKHQVIKVSQCLLNQNFIKALLGLLGQLTVQGSCDVTSFDIGFGAFCGPTLVEPQNAPYTICSLEVHIVYPAYTICSP